MGKNSLFLTVIMVIGLIGFIAVLIELTFFAEGGAVEFIAIILAIWTFATGCCWTVRTTNTHQYNDYENYMISNIFKYHYYINEKDNKVKKNNEEAKLYKMEIIHWNNKAIDYKKNAAALSFSLVYLLFGFFALIIGFINSLFLDSFSCYKSNSCINLILISFMLVFMILSLIGIGKSFNLFFKSTKDYNKYIKGRFFNISTCLSERIRGISSKNWWHWFRRNENEWCDFVKTRDDKKLLSILLTCDWLNKELKRG